MGFRTKASMQWKKNVIIQPPKGAIVFQRLFISLDDNYSGVLLNLLINNSWTLNDSDRRAFPTFMGRE